MGSTGEENPDGDRVLEQWSRAAAVYATVQESAPDAVLNRAVVRRRFRDMTGRTALDAGCGCGGYTNELKAAGADVTGCDGSAEMLKIARSRYPACRFERVDLLGSLPYRKEQFDLVFCNQVLMDLPEINGLFAEFSRITGEGGILFLGIVHSATYPGEWVEDGAGRKTAKTIRKYAAVYRLEHPFCGETTHFHRPISHYLNLAADHQFHLVHMEEPCRDSDISGLPPFLFAEFRKQTVGTF